MASGASSPCGASGTTNAPRTGQDARTPDEQQHAAVTAEGGGLKQVAQALDPIDAPQLMTQPGEAEGLRRTTIQNVPPASLAQAFLEVFAEVGRAPADEAMTAFATAIANGDQPAIDDAASAVGRLLQPDEADPPIVVDLRRFAGAVDEAIDDAALVAAGADLAAAFATLPAESPQQFSAETVDLARAVRPERPGSPPTSRPLAESARAPRHPDHARPAGAVLAERVDVALEQLGESPLGVTTRRLWDGTKRGLDNFRGALEHYFDSEMSRLSGYYKRSIRIVLIVLSVVVTLVANIDALDVANGLWRNPDGRAALIAQADELATGGPAGEENGTKHAVDAVTLARLQRECSAAEPRRDRTRPDPDAVAAGLQEVRTCVDNTLTVLSGLGVIDSASGSARAGGGTTSTPPSAHDGGERRRLVAPHGRRRPHRGSTGPRLVVLVRPDQALDRPPPAARRPDLTWSPRRLHAGAGPRRRRRYALSSWSVISATWPTPRASRLHSSPPSWLAYTSPPGNATTACSPIPASRRGPTAPRRSSGRATARTRTSRRRSGTRPRRGRRDRTRHRPVRRRPPVPRRGGIERAGRRSGSSMSLRRRCWTPTTAASGSPDRSVGTERDLMHVVVEVDRGDPRLAVGRAHDAADVNAHVQRRPVGRHGEHRRRSAPRGVPVGATRRTRNEADAARRPSTSRHRPASSPPTHTTPRCVPTHVPVAPSGSWATSSDASPATRSRSRSATNAHSSAPTECTALTGDAAERVGSAAEQTEATLGGDRRLVRRLRLRRRRRRRLLDHDRPPCLLAWPRSSLPTLRPQADLRSTGTGRRVHRSGGTMVHLGVVDKRRPVEHGRAHGSSHVARRPARGRSRRLQWIRRPIDGDGRHDRTSDAADHQSGDDDHHAAGYDRARDAELDRSHAAVGRPRRSRPGGRLAERRSDRRARLHAPFHAHVRRTGAVHRLPTNPGRTRRRGAMEGRR